MTTAHIRPASPRWAAALAGALAGAVAIAASELVAGLLGAPSLVVAIGALVISLQPPGAKEVMVAAFGTNDKLALNLIVVAAAVAIAAGAGILAARRFQSGAAVFVGFGVVAAAAAVAQPLNSAPPAVLNAAIAVGAALATLRALLGMLEPAGSVAVGLRAGDTSAVDGAFAGGFEPAATPRDATSPAAATTSIAEPAAALPGPMDWPRRRFLIASAGTLGGVIVAGGLGRALLAGRHTEGVVSSTKLPTPLLSAAVLTADQTLDAPGLTPLVIPNDQFYKIDTTLLVPQVDVAAWQLKVVGMVDHELTFTYDELLGMPLFEQYVTIACVSNDVGGHLVGNALWTGARLKDVLEAAGVQAGATQIVGRSVDGFTVGFPTSWATAPEREAMIAVGMNREALPAAHGFPARLIVPGLYGYVSATKWLSEIELTTREAVDGYWIPLGWAKDAPILTQSRIDVPRQGQRVPAGPIEIAGVAWAPDRGITGVEARIDDGAWQAARITRPISATTWAQWVLPWTAPEGTHTVDVRATDGTGDVQTDEVTTPAPDGARGHHRISFVAG